MEDRMTFTNERLNYLIEQESLYYYDLSNHSPNETEYERIIKDKLIAASTDRTRLLMMLLAMNNHKH